MPKFNMILKPGEEIPEEFKEIFKNKFNEKSIDKLKRFGGRIQISLTAPFTDRKEQKKGLLVNKALIERITSSIEIASEVLSKMTLKQIREIAKFVGFPISSKTTVEEARKQLVSYLFSNDTWNKISK
jgi:hypothetical protein